MIYDIFLFHSEYDILKIRLGVLNKYVDKFIIIEANESFNGQPKQFNFENRKEEFAPWADKIIYKKVYNPSRQQHLLDLAVKSPNIGAGEAQWVREFCMKEVIKDCLTDLKDDDICYVSDVDEIWNPLEKVVCDEQVRKLQLMVYTFYLDYRSSEPFHGTIVTRYKTIKNSVMNHIRFPTHLNGANTLLVEHHGWHFTNQGGITQFIRKITSSHTETAFGLSVEQLIENARNDRDLLGRNYRLWVDESEWPTYLKKNRSDWTHLCRGVGIKVNRRPGVIPEE